MYILCISFYSFFFFKQKTAYEMRISDWSSDVCSSDLVDASRYAARPRQRCRGRGRTGRAAGRRHPPRTQAGELSMVRGVRGSLLAATLLAVAGRAESDGAPQTASDAPASDRKSTRMNSSH